MAVPVATGVLPTYSVSDLETINGLYPDPDLYESSVYTDTRNLSVLGIGKQFKRLEASNAHYAYVCPVRQTADIVSSSSEQEPPVWVFHWALNSTVKGGANHGDNMYYESFQDSITSISEGQREVSGIYHAFVTSFITKGNPNAIEGRWGQRPTWERYQSGRTKGEEKVMTFGLGNDERAGGFGKGVAAQMRGSEWVRKECEFWWKKNFDIEE